MPSKGSYWWNASRGQVHSDIWTVVSELRNEQTIRREANIHYLRLYSNRMAASMSGFDYGNSIDGGDKIRMNVVKSAIDAATAQIGTNRPRPMFQTEDGNYDERKKAERLGRFMLGQFHKHRVYEQGLDVFRDGAVFGTGFLKIARDGDGDRVTVERVLADEIVVDDNECRTGSPQMLFQVRDYHRESVAKCYPKNAEDIANALTMDESFYGSGGNQDMITVVESWRLPSEEGEDDGRHVISCNNAPLLDEKWTKRRFPFASFRWNTAPLGYFGIGAAEEIAPIQVEINYIAQKIQKLMTLATSMVWKEKGSFMGKIDNQDMAVREFSGRPPIFQTTSSVSSEYFNHLDRLYNRAYELCGISQMQATSKKPAGIESGEGLRVYNDIGTRRFQHTGQRWEQFFMDVSELLLDCAREADEDGVSQEAIAYGDRQVEKLNFADISLEKDCYVMRVHPVSIIPDTPAGKMDALARLAQMVGPQYAPYLIAAQAGIPDLEAAIKLENAPREIVELTVGNILEHGKYEPPSSLWNLELTRDLATKHLLKAQIDGVSEDRLQMLRQFVVEVDILQAGQAESAGAPQMPLQPPPGAGMMPPGMPGMPPQMQGMPPPQGVPQPLPPEAMLPT